MGGGALIVLMSLTAFPFLQLREYQQKHSPGVPAGAKKKRKIKNGSSPETTTSGDCPTPEDVSLAWLASGDNSRG